MEPDGISDDGRGGRVVVVALLLGLCVLTSARLGLLPYFPQSPANDLSKHAALILNFHDAFVNGQWLPRLQPAPPTLPDLPSFQYYGTLLGYFALPWLSMGVRPLGALVLAVGLARFIGVAALYVTARRLGGSRESGLIAAASYLLTPYIISNVYGRFALPEAIAHGMAPLLTLGWAYLLTGRRRAGFAWIAIGVVAMSLSHPIFLLYGIPFVLALSAIALPPRDLGVALLGVLAGVLLSAFQWGPAFISRNDLIVNFAVHNPGAASRYTSLSGLFGLARPLSTTGPTSGYFFTLGWWTLPLCALAFWRLRTDPERRRILTALLITLIAVLLVTVSPIEFWEYVPRFAWSVQFPYRLLALVALATALLIPVTWPAPRRWAAALAVAVMAVTQIPVLSAPEFEVPAAPITEEAVWAFSSTDYMADTAGSQRIAASDGWLIEDNLIIPPLSPPMRRPMLRVEGTPIFPGPFRVWLAAPGDPARPLTEVVDLPAGRFTVSLSIPAGERRLNLRVSTYVSPHDLDPRSADTRELSLNLTHLQIYDGWGRTSPPVFVPASQVTREGRRTGYGRTYRVDGDVTRFGSVTARVELPLAYSRFTHVTQGGRPIPTTSTWTGRVLVETNDLATPFQARYRIPGAFIAAPILTLVFLVGVPIASAAARRPHRRRVRAPHARSAD